jgi:polysaccharide biosynthesis protein PslH
MTRGRRVLYLTTQFPWPATSGGPVRTLSQLQLAASLPEIERITLLSFAERPVAEGDLAALAGAVPKLRVVPPFFHPIHLWQHPRRVPRVAVLRALGVPYLAGKWDSSALRAQLCRELRDAPDIVYVDHLGMARYLPDIQSERPLARVVLEQHNVESSFFERLAQERRGVVGLLARAEWQAAARFEKRALESVDAVVAISAADASAFEQFAGVRARVVPVVAPVERRARPRPDRVHFCYVGSLRWHPNVAGLDWFCREVWPMVRARLPDATFEIAGVDLEPDANGQLPVPEAWRVPGVATVGFLADLEPLYARSLALVAPVFGGSGVRIKVLEGFRAGVPVVTTTDGAFGLPLADGREALIAGDAEGLAERVVRIARDEGLRIELRDRAYAYLEAHHGSAVALRELRAALAIAAAH